MFRNSDLCKERKRGFSGVLVVKPRLESSPYLPPLEKSPHAQSTSIAKSKHTHTHTHICYSLTIKKFISDNLCENIDGRFIKLQDQIIIIPHDFKIPPYSVFMSGVVMGEIKKDLLFPHHQLFSAYGKLFKRQENLTRSDRRTASSLRGEEIDTDIQSNGWCAVTYEGVALGGGKISGGKIKNHYPRKSNI